MPNLRARIIRLAHAKPELQAHLLPLLEKAAGAKDDYKLNFPSHEVRDALDKLYLKFNRYGDSVRRDTRKEPGLTDHSRLVQEALGSWATTLAKVKESERALYR